MDAAVRTSRSAGQIGRIDPTLSIYLDLARIVAAVVVLLGHFVPFMFAIDPGAIPIREAVVVFLVMSGYVISNLVDRFDGTLLDYALDRLARLWSVIIPAIVLSIVPAALLGLRDATYNITGAPDVVSFIWQNEANLFFLSESWASIIWGPYNAALWTLCFSAWYFAIQGSWAFLSGRTRLVVVAALCFLAGPKVLSLMPCWLLGLALYRCRARLVLRPPVAYGLFVLTILAGVLGFEADLRTLGRDVLRALTGGRTYMLGSGSSMLGDFAFAVIIAANFLAVPGMPALARLLRPLERPLRTSASYGLSIFIYHTPLFAILYGGLGIGRDGGWEAVAAIVFSLAAAVLLGHFTERRRHVLRAWLAGLCAGRVGAAAPGDPSGVPSRLAP